MAVYVIVSYDVIDAEGYAGYVPGVVPLLQKHGAEVLVGDFAAQALEGEAAGVHVVLRFASEEAALNWYHDPEYAPVKQLRLDATKNGRMVLAKEFTPGG